MNNLTTERVVFSIDNPHDIHTTMRFTRRLSQLTVAGKISKPIQCIGYWEGVLEPSWCLKVDDFNQYVKKEEYVVGQSAFLHIPGSPREKCWLEFWDGDYDPLGILQSSTTMPEAKGWTYVIESGLYFFC